MKFEDRVRHAVVHYWRTLQQQETRQKNGKRDTGNRAAVTGGKQMDGFADLIESTVIENINDGIRLFKNKLLVLPGYFRPTKEWDLLIFHKKTLLAAIELKSQRGPSFGNNYNNRSEEIVGLGHDVQIAYREQAFGHGAPRPWFGSLMLLEDCPESQRPTHMQEPHFPVFPEFKDSSYAKRYEVTFRRLRTENLFSETALILAVESGATTGEHREPAEDLSVKRFVASLVGHIAGIVAAE